MNQWRSEKQVDTGKIFGALVVFILIASLFFGLTQAGASDDSEGWQIAIVPYLWALSLDGTIGVKGQTADVDMTFSDILDNLNIALMGKIEVSKGRFGVFVNPLYAKLEGDTSTEILSRKITADLTLNMFILEFGANYRLGPYALGG